MRVTQASPQLPSDVANYGVTVQKQLSAPLMLVALYSPHGTPTIARSSPITPTSTSTTSSPGSRASRARRSSAPDSTRCGTGSSRTSWPSSTSRSARSSGDPEPEHRQPHRPDRRRARAQGPGLHLFGARPGAPHLAGGVRPDRHPGKSRRLDRPPEGRRPGRARRPGLQRDGAAERPAGGHHRRLPAAGLQRARCANGVKKAMAH
jgi:hypothetical protein